MENIKQSASTIERLAEVSSVGDALALFDALEPVDLAFMMGCWQGGEVATGHPMDGLLGVASWYGKEFVSPDCVHPLLFSDGKGGTYKVAPNAQLMKQALNLAFLKADNFSPLFSIFLPLFKTEKSQARLRLMSQRDQVSAT